MDKMRSLQSQSNMAEPATHSDAVPPDVLDARLVAFRDHLTEHVVEQVRALNEQLLREYSAMKPLLDVADVARTLGVSPRTVEKLIGLGKLKPLWVKGQRRFHPDAVTAYLRTCEKQPRSRKRRRVQR